MRDGKNQKGNMRLLFKVRQINPEEVQHLRRRGLPIPNKTKSPSKRSLRRFTTWWETTPVEKFLEDIEFLLQKSAFLTILGSLSNLAIIVAIVAFIGGENVKRNNEVFAAWQTITSAEGQSGSGGKIEALQFLNSRPWRFPYVVWTETWTGWTKKEWFWDEEDKRCEKKRLFGRRWERQPLAGLSAPEAYLAGIKLCGANLSQANLIETDLSGANLSYSELSHSILLGTDFRDVENLKPEQLTGKNQPYLCNVALPINFKNTDIDPNRDCEDIPELLVERSYSKSMAKAKNLVNKITKPEEKAKEQEELSGDYTVDGQNPDGNKYFGKANITYKNGIYNINWTIAGKQKLTGEGKLLKSGLLEIKWNGNQDVTYSIKYEDNKLNKLIGIWANYQGIETLTLITDFVE